MNPTSYPFDQFQRYMTASEIISSFSAKGVRHKILEVGSNEQLSLQFFLPGNDFVFSDIQFQGVSSDISFVQLDATALPFRDGEFDFVVSLDVLEHVPADKRKSFIKECARVANKGLILACPTENGLTGEYEREANETHVKLHHVDYPWLKEHFEAGLPTVADIEKVARELNLSFSRLEHGQLRWWRTLTKLHFIKEADPDLRKLCSMMDRHYNQFLFPSDTGAFCYRSFWVFGVEDFPPALPPFPSPAGINEEWMELFDHVCLMLESFLVEKAELQKDKDGLEVQLEELKCAINEQKVLIVDKDKQIETFLKSRSWRLTRPLRVIGQLIRSLEVRLEKVSRKRSLIEKVELKDFHRNLTSAYKVLRREGPGALYVRLKRHFSGNRLVRAENEKYHEWLASSSLEEEKTAARILRSTPEQSKPLISIIMPVYNTEEELLKLSIESVMRQSYPNWELCITDDASDEEHVRHVIDDYKKHDSRIKAVFNKTNRHISEATNKAIEMSSGDYILFLDHDDELHKHALLFVVAALNENPDADLIYSDEDHVTLSGERVRPFFKPDWSPALVCSQNYIGHLVCISKELVNQVGLLRRGFEGAQDYDLVLRASLVARKIVHIPRILYHWREHQQSTSYNSGSKPYAHDAGKRALKEFLSAKYPKISCKVEDGESLFTYSPHFSMSENTLVSVIIPTRDKVELLAPCINSIVENTQWKNWELIVINNNSIEQNTYNYFSEIIKDRRIKVVDANMDFNWSRINNIGARQARGDVLIFLNNDTLVITRRWMEQLGTWAMLPDVAVVGPLMLYEDETIQHAGVVVGMGGWADHIFKGGVPNHQHSPFVSPILTRNVMAVTGACQVIERSKFETLGGFDEDFVICGSDVELCIRAHKRSLFNVYCADVRLYHLESKSRSSYIPDADFEASALKYYPYRCDKLDPFYNPNLDLFSSTPSLSRF